MIIKCINCHKSFEVSSSLIPLLGRKIQCGSCDHTWFYKPSIETSYETNDEINKELVIEKNDEIKETDKKSDETVIYQQDFSENNKSNNLIEEKKSTGFNFGTIFSYLLVIIFSFIAIIIVLDTFKSPLSDRFPNLELLLYNLFESIKDIFLFIKDLTI